MAAVGILAGAFFALALAWLAIFPAVQATGVATHRFPEGAIVTVDGTAGMVTIEAE